MNGVLTINMKKNNRKSICFVSDEIWPGTGGGIGRLISENGRLLGQKGITPVFLLDVDDQVRDTFLPYAAECIPRSRVYTVNNLLANCGQELKQFGQINMSLTDFDYYFYWRAYLIAMCLEYILTLENIDGIELPDYLGQGFIYLKKRNLQNNTRNIPVWVRLHGSAGIWNEVDGVDTYKPDRLQLYDMESFCLLNCDGWVAPSSGVIEWYGNYYGATKPCFISPPGFQRLGPGFVHPRRPDPDRPRRVLFYGKMQWVKGPDLLIKAALEFLQRDDPSTEFLFVGPDVELDGKSTQKCLERLIPEEYREKFHFPGKIDPEELTELACGCDIAVVPSRAETFCLAAHELNWIGIPLLVSEIPGLDFFVERENCLKFDGTVEGLYRQLRFFFQNPGGFQNISWQVPDPGIPVDELYENICDHSKTSIKLMQAPEKQVAVLIDSNNALREMVDCLRAQDYEHWQVWPVEAGENINRINADFCLFFPQGVRLRPQFLRLALQALENDFNLAGITCYAATEGTGKKYTVPYDLNPYLIFAENILGAVPILWRRDVVEQLNVHDLSDPAALWSFLCTTGVRGESVAVLPYVLVDIVDPVRQPVHVPLIKSHDTYVRENALELGQMYLTFVNLLKNRNSNLQNRVRELEEIRDKMWAELKSLGVSWEEQKSYITGKEAECARLWEALQKSRGQLDKYKHDLDKCKDELNKCRENTDSLLSYLDNSKTFKLMNSTGLLDIERFRR